MSTINADDTTDSVVRQANVGVFRSALLLIVAILLLTGMSGRADAADHRQRAHREVEVRGTLAALPPIVQPGTTPAAPSDKATLVASFVPASPGQRVTLERQTRNGWRAVSSAIEDAWGSAAFSPAAGTYRARTTSGGRTWVTGRVTTTRWSVSFEDTFSGTALDASVWNDQE